MSTYTVTAERSGKWWVLQSIEAPGAISQVVGLDHANEIKEAIAFVTGEAEESIEIDVQVVVPEEIQRHLQWAQQARDTAEVATTQAARETRMAAVQMKELGWTVRDIGAVMKVSYQRAHQLASEPKRRVPKPDSTTAGSRKQRSA